MNVNGKKVLICDCEGTMSLDTRALARALDVPEAPALNTQLCRAQLANAEAASKGGQPVLIGCTQEAPLFLETKAEMENAAALSFVNIRERAGWSKDGAKAGPKIAALIAEAALDMAPATALTMESKGAILILGRDEAAVGAARKLAGRLTPTVLLSPKTEAPAPALMETPVFRGRIKAATGHLGAFKVQVADCAAANPSSRTMLSFPAVGSDGTLECDLILDLRGETALFPGGEKRDGYLRPDPGNPLAVADALLKLTDMVGVFEKPRYIAYDGAICAHSRSQKIGCRRCLDVCPAGATAPQGPGVGDGIQYDAYACAGCGLCAALCPTGAASYQLPAAGGVFERLRVLLGTYLKAGGTAPVLLVHAPDKGGEIIDAIARHGEGLPARVLPFAVNQPTQVGLDFVFVALAHGAAHVRILLTPDRDKNTGAFAAEIAIAEAAMAGLGYGSGRAGLIETADPDVVAKALSDLDAAPGAVAAQFKALGRKRQIMAPALSHLHVHAPKPVEAVALPEGAPFGRVNVNVAGCTLCLSCVGACPTGALKDNQDKPQLSFAESLCVQCGLCRATCPEKVIALEPRLSFAAAARAHQIVKEEEPFHCVRCNKPFGTKSSIERIAEKLKDHPMFSGPAALERLRMCENCRVVAMAEEETHPFAGPPRPAVRTTENYLQEREDLRRQAQIDMAKRGLKPAPDKGSH